MRDFFWRVREHTGGGYYFYWIENFTTKGAALLFIKKVGAEQIAQPVRFKVGRNGPELADEI